MRRTKRYKKKNWFHSKWLLGLLITLVLLISISLVKEVVRSYRINKEIQQLQAQVLGLEGNNTDLQGFVEYLKTDRYFEEQARLKFGKKLPGEKVVVLKEEADVVSSQTGSSLVFSGSSLNDKLASNPEKWFAYFFGIK